MELGSGERPEHCIWEEVGELAKTSKLPKSELDQRSAQVRMEDKKGSANTFSNQTEIDEKFKPH